MRFLIYLILSIILTTCSQKGIILVKVDLNKLTIDNKVIGKTDFEEALKFKIDSLVKSGFYKSQINVQVTADKRTSKYKMSEIEKSIRRQGVARDYIWNEEKR